MNPDHSQLLKRAWRLDRAGHLEQALEAYRGFLAAEPGSAVGWADLGGLLLVLGRQPEAEEACRHALRLDPGHRTAQINLAGVLMETGRLEDAEAWCRRVVARDPARMDGHLALGKCLLLQGDPVQGQAALRQARKLGVQQHAPAESLKHVSALLGDWDALRKDSEQVLLGLSGPARDHEEAHIRLLFGELRRGWELNEARLRVPGLILPEARFAEPRWRGEPFPGRTLLLHWEQGLGDSLMFVRYASMVKALGGTVLVSVQRSLAAVVATCPGVDRVIPYGDPLPPFDLQVSLVSLPAVFQTDLATIPAPVPYLDVPAAVPNRQAIAQTLAASKGRTRVGLVWAGSPHHKRDRERSLAPASLAPLAALPGVAWHSFQLGQAERPPLPGLVDLAPLLGDFADTAYALSGMDLVVAVDTALVHLAGAMGIPTLVLVTFSPDFRWLLHRDDSPWYPSVRLYRQPLPGDWGAAVQRLLRDLQG